MDALRWEIEADALTLIHRGLAECGKTAHREIAQGEIQKWLAPGGDGVVQALALNAGVDFLAGEHAPLGAGGFRFRLVQFQCWHGHACSHFSSLSYMVRATKTAIFATMVSSVARGRLFTE